MRYFYRDAERRQFGPYTLEQLHEFYLTGVIGWETEVVSEDLYERMTFGQCWNRRAGATGAGEGPVPPPLPEAENLTGHAGADLRALIPHLLMPFEALQDWRWLQNRRFLAIAGVGLLPLLLIGFFAGRGDIPSAYWAVALYFSALWGLFFYMVFPAPGVRVSRSLACFFGTGFFSVSLLLLAYSLPPLGWVPRLLTMNHLVISLLTFVLGVGIPEEACKALMLLIVSRQTRWVAPQTMVFYGLMSGLGFGIYEGVGYQLGRNVHTASGVGEYYLLNLIRLTTLPFLHAMWTGIAGYFIGFALHYPRRRYGLWIVAIGVPAVLHGLYNTFSGTLFGFVIGLVSVLALNLYVAKSSEFESALRRDA